MKEQRLVNVDGAIVEYDALRIAERVNEYDPNLRVQVLDGPARSVDQPPFQVVETCKDGIERIAFTAWILDNRLLERIWLADTQKFRVNDLSMENNQNVREQESKRYREERQEAHAIAQSILRSPKDTYTAPNADGETTKFKA